MFELFDPAAEYRVTEGGNLPHWFQPAVTYFVTFRTVDSIPSAVSRRWHADRTDWLKRRGISTSDVDWHQQLAELPCHQRKQYHETFSRRYMESLDKGWGDCVLRQSRLAKIVADSLMHFDGERYSIGDFVVMPNHVHLLVGLIGETDIVAQCYSWKKFAATKINRALGNRGRFWQEESFDHMVRSPEQFAAIQKYIAANPTTLQEGEYYLHRLAKPK